MDLEQYRTASREQWRGSAEGWAKHAEHVDEGAQPATEWMLDAASVGPGDTVLELACGPAGVGLSAADLVGREGRVICSDFAESMVEVARERARELGVENVEFRVLDGEAIDLPDGAVDVVLCRFGYMLMADPARALAESRRVLKLDGRLALAVWSGPEDNPWLALLVRALMEQVGAPPPEPEAPGVFALADQARLRSLLERAGFADVRIEKGSAAQRFDSFDDYWSTTMDLAAPLRSLVSNMAEDDRDAVLARLREETARFSADGGLEFPAAALMAAAVSRS